MFDYLTRHQRTSALPMGLGSTISTIVHAAVLGLFAYEGVSQSIDVPVVEEQIVGLEYIAPPNVNSAASQIQIRYEASGGAEGTAAPTDRTDGTGERVRGSGPGETAVASVSGGEDVPDQIAAPSEDPYENAFANTEVEQQAERDPESAAPVYPKDLMAQGVEGWAAMRFVVDSTGLVDMSTVRVIDFTHPAFVAAVRSAMPGMKFAPARLGERPVRQLAEQMFRFQIEQAQPVSGSATASNAAGRRRPESPQ